MLLVVTSGASTAAGHLASFLLQQVGKHGSLRHQEVVIGRILLLRMRGIGGSQPRQFRMPPTVQRLPDLLQPDVRLHFAPGPGPLVGDDEPAALPLHGQGDRLDDADLFRSARRGLVPPPKLTDDAPERPVPNV
jgi:hypothetical protein